MIVFDFRSQEAQDKVYSLVLNLMGISELPVEQNAKISILEEAGHQEEHLKPEASNGTRVLN